MLGKRIKITNEKKKEIYWDIEDMIKHSNVHVNKIIDDSCYISEDMDGTKINPEKNKLSSKQEMEK